MRKYIPSLTISLAPVLLFIITILHFDQASNFILILPTLQAACVLFNNRFRYAKETYFVSGILTACLAAHSSLSLWIILPCVGLILLSYNGFENQLTHNSPRFYPAEIIAVLVGTLIAILASIIQISLSLWMLIPIIVAAILLVISGINLEKNT